MTISNPTYILLAAHGVPRETRGRVWKTFFLFFKKGVGPTRLGMIWGWGLTLNVAWLNQRVSGDE